MKGLFVFFVLIDINSYYRTEDFLLHGDEIRIGCENNSRFDEVSDGLVPVSTVNDLTLR